MKLEFTKMHGLGNDFIVVDLRNKKIPNLSKVVKKISDRRFGIGFDQAMIIGKSRKADFKMDIYNFDGSHVEMCGNGIRAVAKYIWDRKLSTKKILEIETMAGIIRPEKSGKEIKVDMGEPILEGKDIPTKAKGMVIDHPIKIKNKTFKVTCVSMGNPHAVNFVKNVATYPVNEYGPLLEKHSFFPNKVNVEFIEVMSKSRIKMRVFERGTGETLACGTGACASAVAAMLKNKVNRKVTVELLGGNLKIEWNKKNNRVYMTGPAVEVFTGTINI